MRVAPLRADVRRAADLLRENPARRWTLEDLAAEVHLSPSRLSSVFVEAYGKTPLAFLTMLRAEQLAKLLRETDLTVTTAMQRVGWRSRSHASRLFHQHVGMTPGEYRRLRAQQLDEEPNRLTLSRFFQIFTLLRAASMNGLVGRAGCDCTPSLGGRCDLLQARRRYDDPTR